MNRERPFRADEALVPVHLPGILVAMLAERGHGLEAILAGTGIAAAALAHPESRVSYLAIERLIANALALTGDAGLGADYGRRLRLTRLGLVGFALTSAPNLRAAVAALVRFHKLLGPALEVSLREDGSRAALHFARTIRLGDGHRFALEAWLVSAARGLAALLEGPIPGGAVAIELPEPPHAARLAGAVGLPVHFADPPTRLVFDAALLDRVLPGGEAIAHAQALANAEAALAALGPDRDLAGRVLGLLLQAPAQPPPLAALARQLGLSPRSLNRHLAAFGTSYRRLLVAARREQALDLVARSSLALGDIAARVGFTDPSNFVKAFRGWTGTTPARYRMAALPAYMKAPTMPA